MKDTVVFGNKSITYLSKFLKKTCAQKVLLITGKNSFENLISRDEIYNQLEGIYFCRHSNFENNPKYRDLTKGATLIKRYDPDVIIGIGGGSVLDTSKLLSVLPDDTEKIQHIILGKTEIFRTRSLILIPTTAGSGSESTHFAVVYLNEKKYSIADNCLLPDLAIIDPELTYTQPKRLTATTALDALCQAIESYWSIDATEESMAFAEESIKLIIENYNQVVLRPDKISRERMMKASFLSGKAINISKTTAAHALSYGLTTWFNIPHGHAVALTIGKFILFNSVLVDKDLMNSLNANEIKTRLKKIIQLLGTTTAEEADIMIQHMLKIAGLEFRLRNLGVKNTNQLKLLSKQINFERLKNNPVKVSQKMAYKIYLSIF